MKKEVSPVVIIVALVVVVIGIVSGFIYYASPHTPLGFMYTPGVPPWMEKGAGRYKPTPDYPAPDRKQSASADTSSEAAPAAPPSLQKP